jgi:signal transduction histidine kinase
MATSTGSRPLRVLVVGDEREDGSRFQAFVDELPGALTLEWVGTFEAGLEAMTSGSFDATLVDCRLDTRGGIELLRAYRATGGKAPVIILSDRADRAVDVRSMEIGAADFLVKTELDAAGLERSIRYAVETSRRAAELERIRDELETRVAERTDALETMNEALAAEVAERRAAERALREADRRKDAFFATLAHELRNPLAPLSSAAEILSRTGDTPGEKERGRRSLGVIERQVRHMARLIDDLLDLSRITHGKLELRRERVSLEAVVDGALETAGPLLARRRQAFEHALPEEPVLLHADPMRLAQALSNLLSNAAKFTEPGGSIRLEAVREGGDVVVSVVDSGIGIRSAHLAHVFEMFGQGHRAHDPVYGGLGIGLTLAKSIAELHGGTLTAASEGEGKGSVFTLRVACVQADASAPMARETPISAPPPPRRILVVDDNVDAALTLAELLTLSGHETHVAHDGLSALDAARRLNPDVVILDIGLPGLDGFEVARRLRTEPAFRSIVLVALSGWVQPGDLARSHAAGFDHHFAKPIPLTTLERVLREASGDRGRIP